MLETSVNRFKAVWDRVLMKDLAPLGRIWSGRYPEDRPRKHSLLEKIFITPILIARALSLSNLGYFFSPTGSRFLLCIDLYVLGWATLFTGMLFAGRPAGWIVVVLAVYRVVDVVVYHFGVLLVDSQIATYRLVSVRRSFVFSIVNFYEIIAAYALIYLVAGSIVHTKTGEALSTGTSALYYSMVNIVTLGYGEFCPADDGSRAIVMGQLLTGVLFLAGIAPMIAANIAPSLTGGTDRDAKVGRP